MTVLGVCALLLIPGILIILYGMLTFITGILNNALSPDFSISGFFGGFFGAIMLFVIGGVLAGVGGWMVRLWWLFLLFGAIAGTGASTSSGKMSGRSVEGDGSDSTGSRAASCACSAAATSASETWPERRWPVPQPRLVSKGWAAMSAAAVTASAGGAAHPLAKAGEVGDAHHRRLAADGLEGVQVLISHTTRGDHRDSRGADALVESQVRSTHRSVALDRGDFEGGHAFVGEALDGGTGIDTT